MSRRLRELQQERAPERVPTTITATRVSPVPGRGAQQGLLQLQRAYGNRLTGQVTQAARMRQPVQPQIVVTPPDDHFEHEAERAAETMTDQATYAEQDSITPADGDGQLLQRSTEGDGRVPKAFALATRGVSAPLPYRADLEHAFGTNFAGVRAFLGRGSELGPIGAYGAASGDAITFRSPSPSKALVAHELAHVLQQRRVGVSIAAHLPITGHPGDQAEHEADTAAQSAAAGVPTVVRAAPTGAIQLSYDALTSDNKARVDQQAEKTYADKAEAFEYGLGLRLAEAAPVVEIADELLRRVMDIVNAWADQIGQNRELTYKQEFQFAEGDKYFGSFLMTGNAIKKVFDSIGSTSQPTRKKLKIVYNAVRNNNLAKWLKVAADDMAEVDRVNRERLAGHVTKAQPTIVVRTPDKARTPDGHYDFTGSTTQQVKSGFADRSRLKTYLEARPPALARVQAASQREKTPLKFNPTGPDVLSHIAAPDMWSNLSRGTADEARQVDEANRDRQYNQNQGAPLTEQRTLTVGNMSDLTSAEIRLIKQRRGEPVTDKLGRSKKRSFKAQADDKISWEQGREAIAVMANSPVEKHAAAIGARLEAGISGSTSMMFAAAKYLGLDDQPSLQKLRLAMLGWMLPNHDHSFYEIMSAAKIQGLPFVTHPTIKGSQYQQPANYLPMDVISFNNVLPEGQFPAYFLSTPYLDILAIKLRQGDTQEQADSGQAPDHSATKHRADLVALGLPAASLSNVDARGLIELLELNTLVRSTQFKDETIGNADAQEQARSVNRLKYRYIRDTSTYRYLVHTYPTHAELWFAHLLGIAGAPMAAQHELLRHVDPANLPATTASDADRSQALVAAGIPNTVVADLQSHVIDDLLQLNEMIRGLQFDPATGAQDPLNQQKLRKIYDTQHFQRIYQVPKPMGVTGNTLVGWLLRSRVGDEFYRSFWDVRSESREAKAVIATGVPESIVHSLFGLPDLQRNLYWLLKLDQSVVKISRQPHNKITQLKNLASAFPDLVTALKANHFDMVVATMAERHSIDLTADIRLQTLARAGSVLRTTGPINPPGGNLKFQETAQQTLAANLATQNETLDTAQSGTLRTLTPQEITAINAYSKLGGMGAWQAALSSLDTTNTNASDKLVKLAPLMQHAVLGLRKLQVYPGPVYNAQWTGITGMPFSALNHFRVGSVQYKDNFLSTAKSIDGSFIPKAEYQVAWVIEKVRTGKDIQAISTNFGEEEVLFPPGARFVVTRVKDRMHEPDGHGKVWVYLDEI